MRTAISPGYPEQYALFKGPGHGIAVVTEVQRLCHADEKKLSMVATAGSYGCAHALGTNQAVGWCARVSLSPSHAR